MDVEEYLELVGQITRLPITPDEKESRIIKVVDFKNFKKLYGIPIKIIDAVNHDFCVVEIEGLKKGILFYDANHIATAGIGAFLHDAIKLQEFRSRLSINALWLVFVEEKINPDFRKVTAFIENYNISVVYDKILFFDFHKSTIEELKP